MTENVIGTPERIHRGDRYKHGAAPAPLRRTQPSHREHRTTYLVTDGTHYKRHEGPSLERARTLAIMASVGGTVVHLYRKVDDRLSSDAPIVTYFDGERL